MQSLHLSCKPKTNKEAKGKHKKKRWWEIMEKKSVKIWVVLGVLVAMSGAQCGKADSVYGCLGGCYNKCVVLARNSGASRYPCYIGCINGCVPTTAADDYQNYCQIGCNLQLCSPTRYDGAQLEKCVGRCGNICNRG